MLNDEVQLQRNKFRSDFGGFLPYVRLWGLAVDHSERTKRFTDELTLFTHSGALWGLKVSHGHPLRVMPQLNTDFKLNYRY